MLMLLVLAFGCWLGNYVRSVRDQRDAVAAIKRAGGSVAYDRAWDHYNPTLVHPGGGRRAADWLAKHIDFDYVANVVWVDVVPNRVRTSSNDDDATLALLGRLRGLKHLILEETSITDSGLAQLKGLSELQALDLRNTAISDAGLARLEALKSLQHIWLTGEVVSDDAVLRLEKAIPGLSIWRDEDWPGARLCQRANQDLAFARSQPVRRACALLVHRAGTMAHRNDRAEFIATVEALCDLKTTATWGPTRKAEALARCLGFLQSSTPFRLTDAQRQDLHRRCTESGHTNPTR
jgi:hypothetical protein